MKQKKFKNQKIVIIGGSSGIGYATAKLISEMGANITIGGRNEEKLIAVTSELGTNVNYQVIDVTNELSIKNFFEKVGQFNHLFITGASPSFQAIRDLSAKDAQSEFAGKFWGQYNVVKISLDYVLPLGSYTLMSGGYSLRPVANTSVMSAANGAIESLVRALAVELSPIRVNAVAPGLVDTPLIHQSVPEEYRIPLYKKMEEELLTKRVAQPFDIAEAVSFLMGNLHMTGNTIRIDGGTSLF